MSCSNGIYSLLYSSIIVCILYYFVLVSVNGFVVRCNSLIIVFFNPCMNINQSVLPYLMWIFTRTECFFPTVNAFSS